MGIARKKIVSLLSAVLLLKCGSLSAQEDAIYSSYVPTNNALMFGVGHMNLYDTYLSPLEYTGTSVRIYNEQMKQTSWFNNNFVRQFSVGLEGAFTENPAGNAKEYWLMLDVSWGGHYNVYKLDKFRFSLGGLWNTSLGVLYNERNSNNPASARAYSNVQLSAIAFYKWKTAIFRWQLDTPMFGVLFSPEYGQSYYEISLGNTVGVAHFASFHNQRALRNYFTVDIPLNSITFRLGYLGNYYQTKVNNLQTHTYSHDFVAGVVWESINLSGKKKKKSREIKNSFYDMD